MPSIGFRIFFLFLCVCVVRVRVCATMILSVLQEMYSSAHTLLALTHAPAYLLSGHRCCLLLQLPLFFTCTPFGVPGLQTVAFISTIELGHILFFSHLRLPHFSTLSLFLSSALPSSPSLPLTLTSFSLLLPSYPKF